MKTTTVEIAISGGEFKTVKARPCPIPGLTITGSRGHWVVTHVGSGYIVSHASVYKTNATLEDVRNAMFLAGMVDHMMKTTIDWTLEGDALPFKDCQAWVRSFAGILAHSDKGTGPGPAVYCHTPESILENWDK